MTRKRTNWLKEVYYSYRPNQFVYNFLLNFILSISIYLFNLLLLLFSTLSAVKHLLPISEAYPEQVLANKFIVPWFNL